METELLKVYKERFKCCQDSLKLAREIASEEFIEKTRPPQIVKEIKEKWFRFFQQKSFYKICYHCRGGCCTKGNLALTPIELLYIVANNPDFEFPEPDWKFLVKEGAKRIRSNRLPACLFLGGKGCLLRENKSRICLFYVCSNISMAAKNSGLEIPWHDGEIVRYELEAWHYRIGNHLFSIEPMGACNEIIDGSITLHSKALENLLKRR